MIYKNTLLSDQCSRRLGSRPSNSGSSIWVEKICSSLRQLPASRFVILFGLLDLHFQLLSLLVLHHYDLKKNDGSQENASDESILHGDSRARTHCQHSTGHGSRSNFIKSIICVSEVHESALGDRVYPSPHCEAA